MLTGALAACGGGGGGGGGGPDAAIAAPVETAVELAPGGSVAFAGTCSDKSADATYEWTFPGGTPATASTVSPGPVTFATAGTYTVDFRCLDKDGHASSAVHRAVTVRAALTSQYSIEVRDLTGKMTASQLAAFEAAADRISRVIVGAVSDVPFDQNTGSTCGSVAVNETIHGLVIYAEIGTIDGAGGVLAQSGPCYVRGSSYLPFLGLMEFDSADVTDLEAAGKLDTVVLHEMLHVVGFGTLWSHFSLLLGSAGTSPTFIGDQGLAALQDFNGGLTYTSVPVEGTGGSGTKNGHWRETIFENELMTGWLSGATQPLSRTTVGSLADLGYEVDLTQADDFDLSTAANLESLEAGSAGEVFVGDDIRPFPPQVVDEHGNVQP